MSLRVLYQVIVIYGPVQSFVVLYSSLQFFNVFFMFHSPVKQHWLTKLKKLAGAWDISTDSISLRVTYTQMKSLFSQSALVSPQFWVFEVIFEARRQNLLIFKNSVLYLLLYSKRPSRSYGFNAKIGLKNGPLWAEIFEKNQNGVAVWFGVPC